jgi:WD40 repeat protein
VWDTEEGKCRVTLPGHQQIVRQVIIPDFSCLVYTIDEHLQVLWVNDNLILSGGADEVIRLWDMRSGSQALTAFAKVRLSMIIQSND